MSARKIMRRMWSMSILGGVLAAIAIAMPTTASAVYYPCGANYYGGPDCATPVQHLIHPYAGFQGWGVVKSYYCDTANRVCPLYATTATVQAWRWNGSWSSASLRNDEQVYVYPYAVGWSWVWTARTGWLAAADQYVYIDAPIAYAATAR